MKMNNFFYLIIIILFSTSIYANTGFFNHSATALQLRVAKTKLN